MRSDYFIEHIKSFLPENIGFQINEEEVNYYFIYFSSIVGDLDLVIYPLNLINLFNFNL